ncbi:hypothetical protein ACI3KY_14565 [Microbacterium sp. ZW T2_14]|uniref:hypothetical protein n=1 Tax=Microbacterium sp. ZW T2_14 TaxID=3378079 RepID=UPI00385436D3
MQTNSLALAIALAMIDESVDAYRALLRDHPMDWGEEATRRQQEAADLLDRAQTLGAALARAELPTFSERFSGAYGAIERLETLRAQIEYDPEEDEDIEVDAGLSLAIRLVGGPLDGQTHDLEPLPSDENANGSAPRRIQLPHIAGNEINMLTYLRDSEPSLGEWTYFYLDALDPSRSLEASTAMGSPSERLAEALAHLHNANRELRRQTDAGLQAGLRALNEAVVIAQNELAPAEQNVFIRRRHPVQVLANEMEDRASFDPDWRTV